MTMMEKIFGKKKKCHSCGEEFLVKMPSCPKCGVKVDSHKAEKWGAVIGAFAGSYFANFLTDTMLESFIDIMVHVNDPLYSSVFTDDFKKGLQVLQSNNDLWLTWWKLTSIGFLVGLIGTFVIKKIIMVVKAKKAKSNE